MKTVIEMAREAGFHKWYTMPEEHPEHVAIIERFAALVAAAERKACVKECKKLFKVFLSSEYATGQPLSSFKERHAVAACIESIEARGTHETN